jgi:hypothetical protein
MVTIKTNYQFRNTLYAYELTEEERKEFDYYTDEELEFVTFVRYKGQIIDLGQFEWNANAIMNEFGDTWHGYSSDSYFSGLLVKYSDDHEQVVMGRYYS